MGAYGFGDGGFASCAYGVFLLPLEGLLLAPSAGLDFLQRLGHQEDVAAPVVDVSSALEPDRAGAAVTAPEQHRPAGAALAETRRLLLSRQLWSICTELLLRLSPALHLQAGQWLQDPATIVAGLRRACSGGFDQLDPRLDVPLHELRQALTDLATTAAAQ